MSDLDARLLAAHEADDRTALVQLYSEAADLAESDDARAFYLTHAYVFALDIGAAQAETLRQALVALGREPAR
ncbi:hypothetical protein [Roseobacter sp. A03A-229]